jgi:hypothetical protein
MTKDEALKLALEALEIEEAQTHYPSQWLLKAITAIKEALANDALEKKAENARELGLNYEPVAWITEWESKYSSGKILDYIAHTRGEKVEYTPLYTTPPQRKPLTDEEIDELSRTMVKGNKSVNWLCRAIEAAHGIKGEA